MLLEPFYGNEKAKQTLVRWMRDGRLPHAILLEGEDGCGKTLFARMAAAACLSPELLWKEEPSHQALRNQRLVLEDCHPDVKLVQSEDRSRGFHIEAIRQLRTDAYIKPNDGDRKVYILRNVHNMTEQAQNAMLKLIEEPPPQVTFLLTCANRAKLLPTILSRVALVPILPCGPEDCLRALEQWAPESTPQQRQTAARLSGGCLGKARELLENESLLALYTAARRAACTAVIGAEFELLCALSPYTGNGKREEFLRVLSEMKQYYLEVIRQKNQPQSPAPEDLPQALLNRLTVGQALQLAECIDQTAVQLRQNVGLGLASAALAARIKTVTEG